MLFSFEIHQKIAFAMQSHPEKILSGTFFFITRYYFRKRVYRVLPDTIFIKMENMEIFHQHGWVYGVSTPLVEVMAKIISGQNLDLILISGAC